MEPPDQRTDVPDENYDDAEEIPVSTGKPLDCDHRAHELRAEILSPSPPDKFIFLVYPLPQPAGVSAAPSPQGLCLLYSLLSPQGWHYAWAQQALSKTSEQPQHPGEFCHWGRRREAVKMGAYSPGFLPVNWPHTHLCLTVNPPYKSLFFQVLVMHPCFHSIRPRDGTSSAPKLFFLFS